MATDEKKYTSAICIGGKRISAMREIAKTAFGDSFLYIEIHDGRFIVRVDSTVDRRSLKKFRDTYNLCRVRVYQEIPE